MSNGGRIRTYGRHINPAAELSALFGAHASADVAPRHPEACLPAVSIQHLRDAAHADIDHKVLAPSRVPEQPDDRIMVIEALPQLGLSKPSDNAVFYARGSRCYRSVDVSVLGQEHLWYRAVHFQTSFLVTANGL